MPPALRLALISSPRSGNTWFRRLLQHCYTVPGVLRHEMTDRDWAELLPECVLQIHWPRTAEFDSRLAENGFRVLTIARHPLDVLISVLHFAWYEPTTADWLRGDGGSEDGLLAASPNSRAFVEYATGPRAAALLRVTCDWWGLPDVIGVKYEDLVADTAGVMVDVTGRIAPIRCPSPGEAVAACAMESLRRESVNNHYWKGKPGVWRELLPAAVVREIVPAIAPVLEHLGYDAVPDPALTPADADRNWVRFAGAELRDTVRRTTDGFRLDMADLNERLRVAEAERDAARAEAIALREELNQLVAAIVAVREHDPAAPHPALIRHLGETAGRIEHLFRLRRFPLQVAGLIQAVRDTVPQFPRRDRPHRPKG